MSAVVVLGTVLGGLAPSAWATGTPPPPGPGEFTCRASAFRVDAQPLGLKVFSEPIVANKQNLPCGDDFDEAADASVPGIARANALRAETDVNPDGQPGGQARASAADAVVTVGGQTITAGVLEAQANSACHAGQPHLESSGRVVSLKINGKAIAVEGEEMTIPVNSIVTVYVNRVIQEPHRITRRALEVDSPALKTNVVISEAIADVDRCTIFDRIIDADGTASPQSGDPGAREVLHGDALDDFPQQVFNGSGLDMFDQDGDHKWTMGPAGDDLHVEGPAFCHTGVRDGNHDLGFDCKVLDINGSLANNEPVDCDVEVGFNFTFGPDPCPPIEVKYHDRNNNNAWDNGEDIVFDGNNNNVFD